MSSKKVSRKPAYRSSYVSGQPAMEPNVLKRILMNRVDTDEEFRQWFIHEASKLRFKKELKGVIDE